MNKGLMIAPTITKSTRDDLARWFHEWGFMSGAEIGVWAGHFSKQICTSNPGVRLLCVDSWKASPDYKDPKSDAGKLELAYLEAQKRLAPFACTLRRATSLQAATEVPDGSLDFVYIDAAHDHDHVAADLLAWAPKVRSGGCVSGHDYELKPRSPWIQVKAAVDEYVDKHGIAELTILAGDKAPSFYWMVPS